MRSPWAFGIATVRQSGGLDVVWDLQTTVISKMASRLLNMILILVFLLKNSNISFKCVVNLLLYAPAIQLPLKSIPSPPSIHLL